ncbi:MAG: HAD family hydrolase [Oscillospiraceae bacterium]|nr:HAD family hydrolase [Oscillospiraceae bacterium]
MKPGALIFDIDGTLWDSTGIVAEGYNAHLDKLGHPELHVTADGLKKLFGRTMTEIADVLFPGFVPEERYEIMAGCMHSEHEFLEKDPCRIAFPGVVETLEKLEKEFDLYVVSNSQSGYPELMMEKLGITHLFKGWLCFGDTGTCKGETIRTLMARHGVDSAVYIGDTQGDLEASRLAGLPFVFCRFGFGAPEEYDYAVNSFPELLELF